MTSIPLIGSEHAVRVATLLDALGLPVERHLERARISRRVLEDPIGFLPARSIWTLVGQATESEGLGDFWLHVARETDWRRAGWVPPLCRAATLGEALRAMCASYSRSIPMNELGLTVTGPVAWFWRRRLPDTRGWEGGEPAEQYTLSYMLEVIRAAAGPGWLPEHLLVESPASGWAAANDALGDARITYARPLLALAIPLPLLSIPISIQVPPTAGSDAEPDTSFAATLRHVLKPRLSGSLPSQDLAADLLWTSPRTLRRRLAEEGTTWRAIVQDLSFSRALEKLAEGASVRELAQELGYSDPEHFTRFFRRRAGVPPTVWREQLERGRELARGS